MRSRPLRFLKKLGNRIRKPLPADFVDVRDLLARSPVDELNRRAEEYFARLDNWDYHLAKPLGSLDEAPELLQSFAQIVQGLRLLPGMTIVDFGSGSGWCARFLTQLKLDVVAVDVSPTALAIGEKLFQALPPINPAFAPRFARYDGRRLPLGDTSVDRLICLDAFHHVPNQKQILGEMSRILKTGGIAGFSEPGPAHSKSAQSQWEMRNFTVLENDIVVEEIWRAAREVGFTDIKLAISSPASHLVSLPDFANFLRGGRQRHVYAERVRAVMEQRRYFFLYKGLPAGPDSRSKSGLVGRLEVRVPGRLFHPGEAISGTIRVENTSDSVYLPSSSRFGPVNVGVHLRDREDREIDRDYHREAVGREPLPPGGTAELQLTLKAPDRPGDYILEFDLVSEAVTWFNTNGSRTVKVGIEVRG